MPKLGPFRADQVGSLLRPRAVKDARARFAAGEIEAAALAAVEDAAIAGAVARQAELGLKAVTDGEFRRAWWHFDFLRGLDGVELVETEGGIQFHGIETKSEGVAVTAPVGFSDHPMLAHFRYLAGETPHGAVPKQTIPSPSVLHFRGGRPAISTEIYPDLGPFFDDVAAAYGAAIAAFAQAGCRYLQLDDTVFAYLCDREQVEQCRARGDRPEGLAEIYADVINRAIAERPADMTVTMHLCRGNFRSSWIAQGGYEPVAEVLFNRTEVDGYFLEYDSERAGGFEPLRFVPPGKRVVLGLVTSKSGALESADALKRRIDEAAAIMPGEQICLSPQCGFASTEEGNLLSEDEQWAKLARVVAVAEDVWGTL